MTNYGNIRISANVWIFIIEFIFRKVKKWI